MARILVVDDNADARALTSAHLQAAGYSDVVVAESGEAALALLEDPSSRPVDAVLLDILMDGIDGIETCARIRANPRYTDLPVLMLTAVAEADSLAQAFVAGATDYITKPVNRVELAARLRSALRLKAELDRRRAREAALEEALRARGISVPMIDPVTGLPGPTVFDAALIEAPAGTGVLAILLENAQALRDAGAKQTARALIASRLRQVPGSLGSLLCDMGRGLFAVLVPPGGDPAALARSVVQAVRSAAFPAPAGSLSGVLTVTVGHAVVQADPREDFAKAIAAAERQAWQGHDDGLRP
ncbi:MAG: response regulator [Rhodovarius sp.]|nr:response regulator [Rhodovarius sp.]